MDEEYLLDEPLPTGKKGFVKYRVGKSDTLQKVSKRFYNTHQKWAKIFDANRDQLDDPDQIKPGMILRVPMQ